MPSDNDRSSRERRRPILVLGVGNILLRDEGVGVRVVEAMRAVELPGDVELVDGATAGADLVDVVADRRKVVVIDCVQVEDAAPGTVFRLALEDFGPQRMTTMSLHQVGFLDALTMAEHLKCAPHEVVIVGVQPKTLGCGLELSQEVAEAVPKVIRLVSAELEP